MNRKLIKGDRGIIRHFKSGRLPATFLLLLLFISVLPAAMNVFNKDQKPMDLEAWWIITEKNVGAHTPAVENRISVTMMANLVKYYDTRTLRMFIFNLDTDRFWLVKIQSRTIAEGTFDELRNLFEQKRNKREAELKSMDNMRPNAPGATLELRNKFVGNEKELMELAAAKFKGRASQESSPDISGHKLSATDVISNRKKVGTVWTASDIAASNRWKRFISLMVDLEPERWRIIEAAENVPLRAKLNFGNLEITWELVSINTNRPAISNFILPTDHMLVKPTLE